MENKQNEQNQDPIKYCQRAMNTLLVRAKKKLEEPIVNGKPEQRFIIIAEYPDKENGDTNETKEILGFPCSFYISLNRRGDSPNEFAFCIGIRTSYYHYIDTLACNTIERLKTLIDTHDYSNYITEHENIWSSYLKDCKEKERIKALSTYQYIYHAAQIIVERARKKLREIPAKGFLKEEVIIEYPDKDAGDPDKTKETFGYQCSFRLSFCSLLIEKEDPDKRAMYEGSVAFGYSRGGMLEYKHTDELLKCLTNNYSIYLADNFYKDLEHLENDDNIHR